ncbi:MAG: hypothetical protein Q9214_005533 [Letrouitia sp. 1 TL-2023]
MPVETQFNLALELAQVFNLGSIVKSGATAFIEFARELRKTGSDIVVEEDLADIFGRGRIVPQLEESFRKEVVASTTITPVYAGSEISLCSGPGPTVIRALKEKDRKYLSTVIQLSFLGWAHGREWLSDALYNCILERSKFLSDPYAVPGFEDIKGSLEACSSQTSSFVWDSYIRYVEHSLQQKGISYREPRQQQGLSQPMLLAAMDYFYIIQRLPEDRSMLIKVNDVQDITFGVSSRPHLTVLAGGTENQAEEILLLDREMEVVLRTDIPQDIYSQLPVSSIERHTLRNCGSDMLRQTFNSAIVTADEHPVYLETINLIVAYTIALNSNIIEENPKTAKGRMQGEDLRAGFNSHQSDQWRIFDAVAVMFHDFTQTIGKAKICDMNLYHEMIKDRSLRDILHLTNNLQAYLNTGRKDSVGIDKLLENTIIELIGDVLAFAHASNVRELGMLPVIPRTGRPMMLYPDIQHSVESGTFTLHIATKRFFFDYVCAAIGSKVRDDVLHNRSNESLVVCSEFGWSVIIGNVGDFDPGDIDPFLFCVKKGVPTSSKTGERRKYIIDGPSWYSNYPIGVVDREGAKIMPRCLMPISHRVEYYSVRSETFLLSIRHDVEVSQGSPLVASSGYGEFHNALSHTLVTKLCGHSSMTTDSQVLAAPLGPDDATIVGWSWPLQHLPRICISLVKGDSRARWLVLATTSHYSGTVLRSKDCCTECALRATTALEGQWILIL